MTKKAFELEFISQIKRDGSGVKKVTKKQINSMLDNRFSRDEVYKVNPLSMTEKTFIASGFNSYVVKLIKQPHTKNKVQTN